MTGLDYERLHWSLEKSLVWIENCIETRLSYILLIILFPHFRESLLRFTIFILSWQRCFPPFDLPYGCWPGKHIPEATCDVILGWPLWDLAGEKASILQMVIVRERLQIVIKCLLFNHNAGRKVIQWKERSRSSHAWQVKRLTLMYFMNAINSVSLHLNGRPTWFCIFWVHYRDITDRAWFWLIRGYIREVGAFCSSNVKHLTCEHFNHACLGRDRVSQKNTKRQRSDKIRQSGGCLTELLNDWRI